MAKAYAAHIQFRDGTHRVVTYTARRVDSYTAFLEFDAADGTTVEVNLDTVQTIDTEEVKIA